MVNFIVYIHIRTLLGDEAHVIGVHTFVYRTHSKCIVVPPLLTKSDNTLGLSNTFLELYGGLWRA